MSEENCKSARVSQIINDQYLRHILLGSRHRVHDSRLFLTPAVIADANIRVPTTFRYRFTWHRAFVAHRKSTLPTVMPSFVDHTVHRWALWALRTRILFTIIDISLIHLINAAESLLAYHTTRRVAVLRPVVGPRRFFYHFLGNFECRCDRRDAICDNLTVLSYTYGLCFLLGDVCFGSFVCVKKKENRWKM